MAGAAIFNVHSQTSPHFEVITSKSFNVKEALPKDVKPTVQDIGPSSPLESSKSSSFLLGQNKRRVKFHTRDVRKDRTVFVGNVPASCKKKHIKQLFKPFGSVENIRLRSIKVSPGDMPSKLARRTQRQLVEGSTFNAYVVLSSSSEAERSLSLNGALFQGRHLRVDMTANNNDVMSQNCQRSVFVGNLPFSADEEKLREVFSICGEIDNVRLIRDPKSGVGKGFGFITFTTKCGVIFALKKKAVLDSRTLRVRKSKDLCTLQKEKQSKISGIKSMPAVYESKQTSSRKIMGKRRPDGTKNRYYRLPTVPMP